MTRDEVINALGEHMEPAFVAQAICHDAFDSYVKFFAEQSVDTRNRWVQTTFVLASWVGFRQGWEERGFAQ